MNPLEPPVATIDGQRVALHPGDTILSAATRLGVSIPTLCHADGLSPEGGCRMCLVEIDGQRAQAACHTPLQRGMVVRTQSARLQEVRAGLLELMVAQLPVGSCTPSERGSKFEQLLASHGVMRPASRGALPKSPLDDSHPYMRFDRDRCINCRLCLNACEQIQGQFVYGVEGRGGSSRLIFGPGDAFAQSDCVSCGACVNLCPTGAITDRDRLETRPPTAGSREVNAHESVCGYCGVGCRVRVESEPKSNAVLRIQGVEEAAVNRGHLCVKGRYAHAYHRSRERLTEPLIGDGRGHFTTVSWDEAMNFAASRLKSIRDVDGGDALGVLTSSRSTNEAAYLLQRLFRRELGTNNTDCCARICHSSTALALGMVTGTGAATASYDDLEETGLIVVAGANPTEAHPVIGARIKQAALRGTRLVVIDPRRIELASYASVHLQLWPGTNVPLMNALAKVLIEEGRVDHAYVNARCEGFAELREFLAAQSLAELARVTRVPETLIRKAARLIADAGPGVYVSGLGLSEQSQGVAGVMALCNLGMLTGAIGKRGSGMLPLRGQNNVQGNADMGSQPYALPGYLRLDDEAARTRLARLWGAPPPRHAGMTIPEMFNAAVAGTLRGMWIQGEDVAQSDPNTEHVRAALESLELLIVQELFMTETARMAHVVFPAASVLEHEGTFTNGERRIQRVRAAVRPPGNARPDWEIIRDVSRLVADDGGERWSFPTPAAVMDELAQAVPSLFGGVSYDRLEDDGLQWPCPAREHPGTRTVHVESFVRGRGVLTSVDYTPPLDAIVPEFPLVLITGRVLDHYNVGTMTRRTPSSLIVDRDYLELHPEDAGRLGIPDGSDVHIRSRWGSTVAPARYARRVMPGTAFLTFHFPETQTNCVVGPHVDPTSKCPDYKVVAVALSPVASR